MAGLFVSVIYYYKDLAEKGRLNPWPEIFYLEDKYIEGITPGERGWSFICKL